MDWLATPARQGATVKETGHRPWPLPSPDSWAMGQTWEDLLFAHWPVPVEAVRRHVPTVLAVDVFEGSAWVGITPFRVHGLRLRSVPPVPGLSSFLELNARTYVTLDGKQGIWFFSLDASSQLAVSAARRFYKLPYFRARMSASGADGSVRYRSVRAAANARPAAFKGRYGPAADAFNAKPGSLEYFLAERYCLYTVEGGRVFRADIHHKPWPLQQAVAEIDENTMAPPGIPTEGEPLLHFAARQDVVIWRLEPAR